MSSDHQQTADREPTLLQLLQVLRPQVERIEDAFRSIRVTLDGLADDLHPNAAAGLPAEAEHHRRSREELLRPSRPLAMEPTDSPERSSSALPQPAPEPLAGPIPPPVQERTLREDRERNEPAAARPSGFRAVLAAVAGSVAAPRDAVAVEAAAMPVTGAGGNWSQIAFGVALAADRSIAALSGTLLADVYRGSEDAIGMLGQVLTFRAADAERKPRLLKDLGEAFYQWRPRGDAALGDALIAWIHTLLNESGIPNQIEIVQEGDRFDMQRHNARDRGVEVASVQGWVVLRENGKVFSKANVILK